MKRAIAVGLIGGYLLTSAQLTDGFMNTVGKIRRKYAATMHDLGGDFGTSMERLAYCGWCSAPFITLPIWVIIAPRNGEHWKREWIVGYGVATAVTALYRRLGDVV